MTEETELRNATDPNAPNIGALFKRYAQEGAPPIREVEEEGATSAPTKKKESAEPKTSVKKESTEEIEEYIPEKKAKPKEDRIETKSPENSIDWKNECEKTQRNLKETRRWADEKGRQLSSYKKAVEKFKEEGTLSEEEAKELLDHVKYQELENKNKPFLQRAAEVWDQEIENIRKYSDYEDLDKHLHAFQHFIQSGEQEEIEEFYNDVKDIIDSNPILFTKKMLQIGRQYHEDIFSDLMEAGNLKNFKRKYEDKIDKIERESQKTIQKLEKELAKYKDKYEGYDENPNYRLPQGGDGGGTNNDQASTKRPGQLIEKFNQGQFSLYR